MKQSTIEEVEFLPPIKLVEPYAFESGMTFMTATVNAELAARLLRAFNLEPVIGQSGTNRKHSDPVVARYTDEILQGDWYLSPQTLAFSEANDNGDFELIDGQHRLMAIVEADKQRPGIAVPLSFVFNAPLRAKAVLDTNAARKPAHHLQMSGIKHSAMVAAAAKLMYLFSSVKYNGGDSWRSARWSVGLMSKTLLAHPHLRQAVEEDFRIKTKLQSAPSSVMWALIVEVWGDPYMASQFLQGFAREVEPTDFMPMDPRWRTRMMFDNAKEAHRTFRGYQTLAILIKTFNAWKINDQKYKPYFRTNEKVFPSLLTPKNVEELLRVQESMFTDDLS